MGLPKGSLQVVILAGSFNQDLVAALSGDVSGLNKSQQATLQALRVSLLQRATGSSESRVNTGLVSLHQRKAIEYILRALEGVRRAVPLASTVCLVLNEPDHQLFVGSTKGTVFSEVSDLGLSAANIISNGARLACEWAGDAADLQRALASGKLDPAAPTLVLSTRLTFFPGYNLQRVVEHSLVRNQDTIGVRTLGAADLALLGPEGHTLSRAADTIPVPPLASLAPGSQARVGDEVAEPLLVLQPATLRALASRPPLAPGSDLRTLGVSLMGRQGAALHGIELGVGAVRLDTPAACDYADRLFNYLFTNLKPSKGDAPEDSEGGLSESAAGGEAVRGQFRGGREHVNQLSLTSKSELRDEFVADASETAAAASLNRQFGRLMADTAHVSQVVAEYDRLHFTGERMAAANATKHYVLPPTFYMTAYRRQAADMLR